MLAELSLEPVFRRGHGALYDALADGAVDEERLRDLLAGQLPAGAPLMFGIDATTFPRPNAECSPDRGLHYAPCRCDGDRKVVPGWQFQWVMGLEWGSSSWTVPAGARRLPEGACPVTATAGQIPDLARRLSRRQRPAGRPAPLFVLDQGYAAAALTHALGGLEVQLLVRIAGDRVFYDGRPGPRKPCRCLGEPGFPPRSYPHPLGWGGPVPVPDPAGNRPGAGDPRRAGPDESGGRLR